MSTRYKPSPFESLIESLVIRLKHHFSPPVIYGEYVNKANPEWQAKRKMALEWAGHRCQVCSSPNRLEIHHRTYDRLGAEKASDLTVLCKLCHDVFTQYGRLRR